MSNYTPGQMIGAYQIISQIGKGGMATVYKAYHAAMDRYVALKVLPHQFAHSDEFLGRFQQEVRVIARLEHPRILPVYDYGEHNGIPYLVMRYLEAGTLSDRIKAGNLSPTDIDRIIRQLLDALGYAHEKGVIHRDIKPSNVMIDRRGDVFLTDFGIAKLVEGTAEFTATGAITGTPAYMSPEQAQGKPLDIRSDIYSLGIVLYEMITGRVPFEAETPLAVLLKKIQEPPPPPSLARPDIHPALEAFLLKALARNPDDRYTSADEFLAGWSNAQSVLQAGASTAALPLPTPAASAPPAPQPISSPAPSPRRTPPAAPPPPQPQAQHVAQQEKPARPPRKRLAWLVGGGAVLLVICCGIGMLAASLMNRDAGPTTLHASPPPSIQGLTLPSANPPAGWTNWSSGNTIYALSIWNNTLFSAGPGGLTVWDRQTGQSSRITAANGLPGSEAYAVLVDPQGVLWVGTDNGLGRWDGSAWKTFDQDGELDSDIVTVLAQIGGQVCAGTHYAGFDGGGLQCYDGARWRAVPDIPSTSDDRPDTISYNVTTLLEDGQGAYWVGTSDGLAYFGGGGWTVYDTPQGLPHPYVNVIFVDSQGSLWVGTQDGAAILENERFIPQSQLGELSLYDVRGIVEDDQGAVWLSGLYSIVRYQPSTGDWTDYSLDNQSIPTQEASAAVRAADGRLYFGSFDRGVLAYQDGFQNWQVLNALPVASLSRILPAPDRTLWFMEEWGSRVTVYDPSLETWKESSLPADVCCLILLAWDSQGYLWAGGDAGLWILEPDRRINLTTNDGLPSNNITAVAFDPQGITVVGTDSGLAILENNAVSGLLQQYTGDLLYNQVKAILPARDGSLWVATERELSHFTVGGLVEQFYTAGDYQTRLNAVTESGDLSTYNPNQLFSDNLGIVTDLAEARDGVIWVTTDGDGAYAYDNGAWRQYGGPDHGGGLGSDSVNAVTADPAGGVWFGLYYEGAMHFDGQAWKSYTFEDGLVHPNVNDIYIDSAGNIWFATSGGLSRFTP